MKRMLLPATAALITLTPAVAAAKPPTAAHARAYEHAYHRVAHQLGRRVPGRNIVRDGFAAHQAATDAETVASLSVLQRMLPAAATTSSPTPAGRWPARRRPAPPGSRRARRSPGTNYSTGAGNTNASSGATGRYQILPSTAAAYGCSLGSAAGQDACAQTIYQHQGAGAWVGCGG